MCRLAAIKCCFDYQHIQMVRPPFCPDPGTASKCRLFATVSYEIRFRNNFRLEHVRSRLRDGPLAIHHVLTLPLIINELIRP
jgi:hypothetical protein